MRSLRTIPFALLLTACAEEPAPLDTCPGLPEPGDDAVTTTLPIALFAGDEGLALGEPVTSEAGVVYTVQKLKAYVSEVELVREDGSHEHALLLDEAGAPLAHGVHLVDADDEGSLALTLRAPAGTYAGLHLTIGVPATCPDQLTPLNHADASTMPAPLDVDSDMYWSWDPGYVFFKIEGRVAAGDAFFYHVGEDARLVHVALDGDVVVVEGTSPTTLAFDANRVFVTPEGDDVPRLDGDDDDRAAHGGPLADQVGRNLEGSAALSLR